MGVVSATMVVVGGVIGSGIFLKPLLIARSLPDAAWIHGCWIALGAICLLGSLCYAELGAMLPEAGGQYAFLRESYGRFPAFLYGWCLFLVINTGTIAALSTAFADSLLKVVALPSVTLWHVRIGGGVFEATTRELVAIAMILLVATLNHVGVGVGAAINNLATFAKIAVLLAIAIGGFFVASHGGAGGAANAVGANAAGAGAARRTWRRGGSGRAPFISSVTPNVRCAVRCLMKNARPMARGWTRFSDGPPSAVARITRKASRSRTW